MKPPTREELIELLKIAYTENRKLKKAQEFYRNKVDDYIKLLDVALEQEQSKVL